MKEYLKITSGTRVPFFAVGLLLSILIVSCGGGYGGGGGGTATGTFSLSMPTNMATGVSLTPTLTWTASAGANSYTVQLRVSTAMTYSTFASGITTTSFTVPMATPLLPSTMYDWQVMADGIYGTITAGPFSFTTGTM